MHARTALAGTLVLCVLPPAAPEAPMHVESVTPILSVEAIEPCLPFWTEGLGFRILDRVPEGEGLGFVILERGGIQVMLQTGSSVAADLPALAEEMMQGPATLFVRVDDVEGQDARLEGYGAEVVVPRRQTFYGADEIFVRSPCGTIVGLAAFPEEEAGGGEG